MLHVGVERLFSMVWGRFRLLAARNKVLENIPTCAVLPIGVENPWQHESNSCVGPAAPCHNEPSDSEKRCLYLTQPSKCFLFQRQIGENVEEIKRYLFPAEPRIGLGKG